MLINKDIKIGVISSILGAVIFLCLQPLLVLIWKLLKDISLSTYSGYINSIYRQAAVGMNEQFSFMILAIISLIAVGILISTFIQMRLARSRFTITRAKQSKINIADDIKDREDELILRMEKLDKNVKYVTISNYIIIPIASIYAFVFLFGFYLLSCN